MPFTLTYDLDGSGWASGSVVGDSQSFHFSVSYLRDSLKELVDGVNLLLKGGKEAKVLFMDEPGELLMILTNPENQELHLEMRWFKDWASWDCTTDKEFEVKFKSKTSLEDFSKNVNDLMLNLYSKYGLDGYKAKWIEHQFPIKELEKLQSLIAK